MSFPVTNKGQIERHVGAKICSYDPFSTDMLSETEFFQRQASYIGNGTSQRQLMKCDAAQSGTRFMEAVQRIQTAKLSHLHVAFLFTFLCRPC